MDSKNKLLIIVLFFIVGCGGASSTTSSDNPPDVEGTYRCISGCSGECLFSDIGQVIQSGDQITVRLTSDVTGSINNDGEFSIANDEASCEGQFIQNTATAECSENGINCQQVTYQKLTGEELIGTFSYRPDEFFDKGVDESFCRSSCRLTFTSPIRIVFNYDTNAVLIEDTNEAVIFSGTLNDDDTFDFSFQFPDDQMNFDNMTCSGSITSECGLSLARAACSSNTTGACKLFFERL